MKNRVFHIILAIMLIAPVASAVPDVLVIDFTINKNDLVVFNEIKADLGIPSMLSEGEYQIQFLDSNKSAFFSQSFPVNFYEGEPLKPSNVTRMHLRLNYHPDVRYVRIVHNNKTIGFQSIEVCNSNGKCDIDKGEFYLNCAQDCPSGSKDGYCDKAEDKRCDPDCSPQTDEDCPLVEPSTAYTIAVIAGALILVWIAYLFLKRRQWQGIYEKYRYRVRQFYFIHF